MSSSIRVEQVVSGYCLSYWVIDGSDALLIDPHITQVDAYRATLADKKWTLAGVVDTHTHADHVSSAAILQSEFDCPIYMSAQATSDLEIASVDEGDTISVGQSSLKVLAAPGHTDDSIALLADGMLFTGDVCLIGSVGRTDFQNGSPESMFDTLARFRALPDETVLWPAHDYNGNSQSTLAAEKQNNPFLAETDRDAFVARATAKTLPKPSNMDAIIATNRAGAKPIVTLSPAEARPLLAGDTILLDVRRPDEIAAERIEPSLQIVLDQLASRTDEVASSGKTVLCLCRSGGRASMAASILQTAGVADVRVIKGGLLAWRKAGFETIETKVPLSLERQIRTIAGSLVLLGVILAVTVSNWWLIMSGFVGCGLIFAGLTDNCMMGMMLMKLPYNQRAIKQGNGPTGGSCSLSGGGCSM